jgi:hypothetical protein
MRTDQGQERSAGRRGASKCHRTKGLHSEPIHIHQRGKERDVGTGLRMEANQRPQIADKQ